MATRTSARQNWLYDSWQLIPSAFSEKHTTAAASSASLVRVRVASPSEGFPYECSYLNSGKVR